MDKWKVRFEQNRGHWLVVEGDLSRADCDAFQLRMLQSCEVPGLLKPETQEIDGRLTLRYSLSGTRMLSQTLRAAKWSMADLLAALCRVAEVLEDARLYVLDESRIVLDDDRIFVGEGWNDLRFLYLPLQAGFERERRGVRDLVVRWIMHVEEPDGTEIQRLLRLSAAPDFKPADLRTFARLASAAKMGPGAGRTSSWTTSPAADQLPADAASRGEPRLRQEREISSSSQGWRWFQPSSSEALALSGLLGEGPELDASETEPSASGGAQGETRKKIWILCAFAGFSALSWRWGYAAAPGRNGLLLSAGLTLAAAAGALVARRAVVRRRTGERRGVPAESGFAAENRRSSEAGNGAFDAAVSDYPSRLPEVHPFEDGDLPADKPMQPEERTRLLTEGVNGTQPAAVYCLRWESQAGAPSIALHVPSFIIGRSKEACSHVDETPGVSRAHLELLREGEGWTAKDLGSRNGTKLNGAAMAPYEAYPLQADDCLDLAGSRYRLKRDA